jgi:hypothetical protein
MFGIYIFGSLNGSLVFLLFEYRYGLSGKMFLGMLNSFDSLLLCTEVLWSDFLTKSWPIELLFLYRITSMAFIMLSIPSIFLSYAFLAILSIFVMSVFVFKLLTIYLISLIRSSCFSLNINELMS